MSKTSLGRKERRKVERDLQKQGAKGKLPPELAAKAAHKLATVNEMERLTADVLDAYHLQYVIPLEARLLELESYQLPAWKHWLRRARGKAA